MKYLVTGFGSYRWWCCVDADSDLDAKQKAMMTDKDTEPDQSIIWPQKIKAQVVKDGR